MRNLIDIAESAFDDEEQIARDDARMEREKRVERLIRHAFKMLGLPIADDVNWPVSYDEEPDREAIVILEDVPRGHSLRHLAKLYDSGLSNEFVVAPGGDTNHIEVRFIVSLDLDHATPSGRVDIKV